MPIYEYQCESCGHRQDALQRISDDPLVDCAACGQPALKKLMSAPRFRLKGSGWYETDFKTENKRNLADDGSKGDGGNPKSDDGAKADAGTKGEGGAKKGDKSDKAASSDATKTTKKTGDGGGKPSKPSSSAA